jgi:predicted dehydrogenase
MSALDAGFHVMCEKPMTMSMDEATNLARKLEKTDRLFCLMNNFTGHAAVKEARQLVARGRLGQVRRVVVEYPQGWLVSRVEAAGHKQAAWRTDPQRAGTSGSMADGGTHCQALSEYVIGAHITEVCADLTTFVKNRQVDDDGSVLLRFDNGVRGVLWATTIAAGARSGIRINVYGEKGSLEWAACRPDALVLRRPGKPEETRYSRLTAGGSVRAASAAVPDGYNEGYLDGFASIYDTFAGALGRTLQNRKTDRNALGFPSVDEGIRSIAFLDAVVESAKSSDKWTALAV